MEWTTVFRDLDANQALSAVALLMVTMVACRRVFRPRRDTHRYALATATKRTVDEALCRGPPPSRLCSALHR
jgi:hypothetical protein